MSPNLNRSENPDPKAKKLQNLKPIGLGLAGVFVGAILTVVVTRYNSKELSSWKFDPTVLHTDRVELSKEESARPDKQFIELLLPYEKRLSMIAQQAIDHKQSSAQVKQLARTVIETQERIQIETQKMTEQGKPVGDAQGKPITVRYALKGIENKVDGLENLYKSWYKVDLDLSRTGLNSELLQPSEDVDREFIREMIRNERMAVKLAFLVVDSAENPEIRVLAKDIIEKQGAEIQTLHDTLADLKPASPSPGVSTKTSPSPEVKPTQPAVNQP